MIFKNKNNGLTLIEALIWFAVFAAVVAGVFSLYAKSRDESLASSVNREISTMFAKLDDISNKEDSTGLNPNLAYRLGAVPSTLKMSNDGYVLKNSFGGSVNIVGLPPSGFLVTYTNVPYGRICSAIMATQSKVGWNYMIDYPEGNKITFDSTYSINKVASVCKKNGSGSFEFSLYKNPS
jgi:hypothetical protein